MKFHITVRSWWLLAFSLVLAAGAVYVIVLDDWRHGAELSADHGMFFLLFSAVLLAGLFIAPAWSAGKWVSSLVLVLVTICATLLLAAESAGRVAKGGFAAEASANKDAGQMKGAQSDLEKARTSLADANANFAKECGSGKGTRCKGLKEAVDTLEMQFYKAQTRVDSLKPAVPANGTAAYFAAWGDVLGSADSAAWGKAYVLSAPLGKVVTFDICILALLHLALGVALVSEAKAAEGNAGGEEKPVLALPAPVLADDRVLLTLSKHGPLGNKELADKLGVVEGTASKWVQERVNAGLLRKERDGRHVQISLAHH